MRHATPVPAAVLSLGTIFTDHPEFYRACLDAFDQGPWQVAMTVGELDPATLGPIPATVDVRRRFPQPAVLRHAAAFVSHAGMNSTMEALYYGVPLITLPQMPEQVANAERVTELGLGERLEADTPTPSTRWSLGSAPTNRSGPTSTACARPSTTPAEPDATLT